MPHTQDHLALPDAWRTIAVMGDLSMGQPIDHSHRVALLRWSGCTANAEDIAATISDDVDGRAAMLALQFERIELRVPADAVAGQAAISTSMHCEGSSRVAEALRLRPALSQALSCVFDHWDGSGAPRQLQGDAIPPMAMLVAVRSELEIFARVHGLAPALQLLRHRADVVYPAAWVDTVWEQAAVWLPGLDAPSDADAVSADTPVGFDLVGHLIDLKLPWLLGLPAAVVGLVDGMAAQLGLAPEKRRTLRQAGWLHGLGRVAVPNSIWNRADRLSVGEWERLWLAPYWTQRALRPIQGLADAAELASYHQVRLDGSGHFRGVGATALSLESHILGAAVAWVEMRADRP